MVESQNGLTKQRDEWRVQEGWRGIRIAYRARFKQHMGTPHTPMCYVKFIIAFLRFIIPRCHERAGDVECIIYGRELKSYHNGSTTIFCAEIAIHCYVTAHHEVQLHCFIWYLNLFQTTILLWTAPPIVAYLKKALFSIRGQILYIYSEIFA